jgi:Tfp pilus assembly protein PilO
MLPLPGRLLAAFILGILPGFYIYLDQVDSVQMELNDEKSKLEGLEVKFEKERARRSKLPELENKLAFTDQQLKESSKRLPDDFRMNEVLQEAGSVARDVGVELQEFDPGLPQAAGEAFRYMELPIQLSVTGKFTQIATFYDRLVSTEKMVHIKNIKLMPKKAEGEGARRLRGQQGDEATSGGQRAARSDFRVESKGSMVIYRAMTAAEESKFSGDKGSNSPAKGKGEKGKTPVPPNGTAQPPGKAGVEVDEANLGSPEFGTSTVAAKGGDERKI